MKIDHIAMYVNDLEGARKFFEKYMGAISNNLYHNEKNRFQIIFSNIWGWCKIRDYE